MSCLVMLAPYMYVSGAEEKVVRVFKATLAFKNRLGLLTDVEDFKDNCVAAHGATVPSLGLTNKATFDETFDQCENKDESPTTHGMYQPPTEEELMQDATLWPELQKLYGHGYEIFCMAVKHDGKLLATACKSTSQEHAAIILWSTDTWSQVDKLIAHHLTVTQMEFSPNDKYLLAVSRDRTWSLFKNEGESYSLVTINCTLHARIIWCCGWTQDSKYFATGSRDAKLAMWSAEKAEDKTDAIKPEIILDTFHSVTALCFAPNLSAKFYILAIGYEVGHIEIHLIEKEDDNWKTLIIPEIKAHHLAVKRLKFRPTHYTSYHDKLELASCSSDHSVQIYNIHLPSLLLFM